MKKHVQITTPTKLRRISQRQTYMAARGDAPMRKLGPARLDWLLLGYVVNGNDESRVCKHPRQESPMYGGSASANQPPPPTNRIHSIWRFFSSAASMTSLAGRHDLLVHACVSRPHNANCAHLMQIDIFLERIFFLSKEEEVLFRLSCRILENSWSR